jgi:hypothetical protein
MTPKTLTENEALQALGRIAELEATVESLQKRLDFITKQYVPS